ncbi:MAG TPA: ABC transporter substrate-binding protein [Stellaceae bacterium]|jgi:NitT/TauT family transport system substrate-binding protein|nr:ABC transporter substrate-binding protein [Stellaceae bacterium]
MGRWLRRGRRGAFIISLLCCVASALMPAAAGTPLTVGKSSPTGDALLPVNIGDELGIFKKHGLDLKIIDFSGGSKMAQAVAAGSVDIGDGAGTEMAFVAKGAPMLGVCESAGPAPYLGVGVPWDSPVKKLQDLRGKTIGVSTPGSFSDWLAHQLAQRYGWGKNGVTTVAIGNGAATVAAAFKTHQVDANISNTSIFLAFEDTKEGHLIAPVSSYSGNVASGVLYASRELITKDPEAIRAFIAAWIETTDYMRAHKAETVKITAAIAHFDENVMAREYDLTIAMHTKDCRFDAESLTTLKQSFYDLKLVDGEVDMTKLYTEVYAPR